MASTKRSDGDGSIYYDKARDRYIGSLVVGWRDGKPVRRKVSGKSRAAAATKLRELRAKVEAGTLPAGRVPTVEQWLNVWLRDIAPQRIRETTIPSYRSKVDRYLIPHLGQHRLDRLRPEHLEAAYAELGKTLSSVTILQAHRILSRALKVAEQRGYVGRNVATLVDPPAKESMKIEALTLAQAKRILDVAKGKRNAARWSVALAIGLRQGEALGLTWDHVDLEDGMIRVRQSLARIPKKGLVLGPVKSSAGERNVTIPDALLAELRAHRKAQNAERLVAGSWWDERGFVFATAEGKPIDPRRDWGEWKALLEEAGVPHHRLHSARHTAATMLLAQGVPTRVVMDILGHSQISVTSKYQHPADDMQREAMRRQGTALWG